MSDDATSEEAPEGATSTLTAPAAQSIARNTFFSVLVQATTAIFTAATTLYLVRALGPTSFGVFSLAMGIAGTVALFARCGIPQSLARFLADARHDAEASAGLIRDAMRLTITTSFLTGGALFVAAGPIASAYGKDSLTWPLRGLAVSLVAETILALYMGAFVALARINANLRIVFTESFFEASATIALVAAGAGATGAAFGRAIGYTAGAALAAVMVTRLYHRTALSLRHVRAPSRRRAILRYGAPLFVLDAIYGLYGRIDVLLIGGILNAASVGVYSAPKRLLPGLEGLSLAVANSVSPRQAPAEQGRHLGAFTTAIRWLLMVYAAMTVFLLVWAPEITSLLFGSQYGDSALVLQLLTPFIFLNSISPLVATTANYLGLARQRIPIAAGALILNVVIDVILLPRMGVAAASIGTSAAFAIYVPAHLVLCRREMGFALRPILLTALRAGLAAAAMGAVLALAAAPGLNAFTAVAASVIGVLAFAATLLVTREVTVGEARAMGGTIAARLGLGRR